MLGASASHGAGRHPGMGSSEKPCSWDIYIYIYIYIYICMYNLEGFLGDWPKAQQQSKLLALGAFP